MEKRSKILSCVLASISLAVFLLFTILVLSKYNFRIDSFNYAVANIRTPYWNTFFKIFTYIGSFYVLLVVVLTAFLIIYFITKHRLLALSFLSCFVTTCFANLILKYLIQRARPENLMIIEEFGFAFPSGHAMMTFVVFGFFIYLLFNFLKNRPLKVCLIGLFSTIIVLIGFSRIYLGVHYLSDVIAGWLISFVVITAHLLIYKRLLKNK